MKYLADQMIDAGEMLPSFCLPAAGGRVVDLWTYKQRQQVILLVLHGAGVPGVPQGIGSVCGLLCGLL